LPDDLTLDELIVEVLDEFEAEVHREAAGRSTERLHPTREWLEGLLRIIGKDCSAYQLAAVRAKFRAAPEAPDAPDTQLMRTVDHAIRVQLRWFGPNVGPCDTGRWRLSAGRARPRTRGVRRTANATRGSPSSDDPHQPGDDEGPSSPPSRRAAI
jgi:hypothetical protein